MKVKAFLVLCFLACLVLALSSCAPAATTPETPAEAEPVETEPVETEPAAKPLVALVCGVRGDAFYYTMEAGARAMADELGLDLVVDCPSEWNAALQTPIVDAMIARKPAALILVANDPQAMIEPAKRAFEAGIPVLTVDGPIGDGDYVNGPVTFPLTFIASNNAEGGKMACESLIEMMGGKGKIYIQNYVPGIPTAVARADGCREAIDATNGAVTFAGEEFAGQDAAKAAEQTAAVLQRDPDITGIFGTNSFAAQGAAQAVANANLGGIVKVATYDAPEDAIKMLREKVVDIVIAQLPRTMGSLAVQYAYDAIQGNTADIPKLVHPGFFSITRDNVDTQEAQDAIYKAEPVGAEPVETEPVETEPAAKPLVALVCGVRGDAFYYTMEAGARAMADELGLDLVVDCPSEWNAALQTPIVDAMIARKPAALILVANDPQAMIEPAKRAFEAGIPVLTVDGPIGDGDYVNGPVTFPLTFIASNNAEGGKMACEIINRNDGWEG